MADRSDTKRSSQYSRGAELMEDGGLHARIQSDGGKESIKRAWNLAEYLESGE